MRILLQKIILPTAVSSLLFLLAVGLEYASPHVITDPQHVTVWVFDVGQGDAIFVQGPEQQVLIDGGPNEAILEELNAVMPFWDRHIDYLINTHPHADHVTGLVHVLDHYEVSRVYTSGQRHSTNIYEHFLQEVNDEVIMAGDVIDLGSGARLHFLWPDELLDGKRLNDPNAGSLVALLTYRGKSMLLTGDIGVKEEAELLDDLGDIDVLKVGHQGSDTSSSRDFLDAITPEYAIISVGENDYGHPDSVVMDRIQQFGAELFRTDTDGSIKVEFGDDIVIGGYQLGL